MSKISLKAACALTTLAISAGAAQAAPTLSIEAFTGSAATGTAIALTTTQPQEGVAASFGTSASGQSVSVITTGVPVTGGLKIANITSSATAGSILTIVATQQGLTSSSSAMPFSFVFGVAGGTTGTVTFSDFIDPTNGLFTLLPADLIGTGTLSLGIPRFALGSAVAAGLQNGMTYSETEEVQISFLDAGISVTASSLTNPTSGPVTVPEPASLALFGAGLLALMAVLRGGLAARIRSTLR